MPYKSKAQQRKFHAMEASGEIDSATVKEFDEATKKTPGGFKSLPEKKKKKKKCELKKAAAVFMLIKEAQALLKVGTAKGKKGKKAKLGSGGRFKALERKLGKSKKVKNPKALAASIMYAKYGKGKGQAMAKAGSMVTGEPEQEPKREVAKWLGASIGTGLGATAALIPLMYGTAAGKAQTTQKTTELVKSMLKRHGIKGMEIAGPTTGMLSGLPLGKLKRVIGAGYNPINKRIHLPPSTTPLVALHEAGHAVNAKAMGRAATPFHITARQILPKLIGALGLGSILWGGRDNTIVKYAPYIVAASGIPMVAEEAIATGRALSYIKKMQGWRAMLKNLPQGLGQVGGYALGGMAIPAVGMLLAKRYLRNPAAKETT